MRCLQPRHWTQHLRRRGTVRSGRTVRGCKRRRPRHPAGQGGSSARRSCARFPGHLRPRPSLRLEYRGVSRDVNHILGIGAPASAEMGAVRCAVCNHATGLNKANGPESPARGALCVAANSACHGTRKALGSTRPTARNYPLGGALGVAANGARHGTPGQGGSSARRSCARFPGHPRPRPSLFMKGSGPSRRPVGT